MKSKLVLLAVCATFGLAACAAGDLRGFGESQAERRAQSLSAAGRHVEAAGVYIDLATQAADHERQRLTLLAAEQWLDAGDGRRAKSAMQSVPVPGEGELLWLWQGNAAALALWEGRPDDALQHLEALRREPLPLDYRSRIEALRADAWFQKGDPAQAVQLYIQRENWLEGRRRIELNRKRLWDGLLVSRPETLRAAADTATDREVRGWLTLAALATSTGRQGVAWSNGVTRWQSQYPDHGASDLLGDMPRPEPVAAGRHPSRIALLLPLSGRNATAGGAIRNGFFGAYFASAGELEEPQTIRVYDVAAVSARESYERAVADGAEFVVGPLLRPEVSALVENPLLPVPVLALNYLPDDAMAPPGFYQFALAPEDEAASAATRAIADGHRRAVALVPDNDWGKRVLNSFASAFESSGGSLLDFRTYHTSGQDFSFEIEGLLALTQSMQRYERLRANIGGTLHFDPRRRQDVDFVFLAADAKAGRLLKSQLKFHYAGALPVYATSFIYSMDGRSDADLNGVMFADTPWLISPHAWIADLPRLYGDLWPEERRLTRLHAMGYDAYQLIVQLSGDRTGPMEEIAGATGTLYLDEDGRVHRRLAWAQFVRGTPVALPDARPRDRMLREPGGG